MDQPCEYSLIVSELARVFEWLPRVEISGQYLIEHFPIWCAESLDKLLGSIEVIYSLIRPAILRCRDGVSSAMFFDNGYNLSIIVYQASDTFQFCNAIWKFIDSFSCHRPVVESPASVFVV